MKKQLKWRKNAHKKQNLKIKLPDFSQNFKMLQIIMSKNILYCKDTTNQMKVLMRIFHVNNKTNNTLNS